VPRLLINREVVGTRGTGGHSTSSSFDFSGNEAEYRRDALFLGDCDDGCVKLAELMGLQDELTEAIKTWKSPEDMKPLVKTESDESPLNDLMKDLKL
jgi:hypothetical protein